METVKDLIDFLQTQNQDARLSFVYQLEELDIASIEEYDEHGEIGEGTLVFDFSTLDDEHENG